MIFLTLLLFLSNELCIYSILTYLAFHFLSSFFFPLLISTQSQLWGRCRHAHTLQCPDDVQTEPLRSDKKLSLSLRGSLCHSERQKKTKPSKNVHRCSSSLALFTTVTLPPLVLPLFFPLFPRVIVFHWDT